MSYDSKFQELKQERDDLTAEVEAVWTLVGDLRHCLMQYGHLPDCSFLKGGSTDCWCPGVVPPKYDAIANNALMRNLLRAAFIDGAVWANDDTNDEVESTLRKCAHQAAMCRWPEQGKAL